MRYLLLLFLVGCAPKINTPAHNSEFDHFVNLYAAEKYDQTGQAYTPISISFGEMSSDESIGECHTVQSSRETVFYVVIDPIWWTDEDTTDVDRYVLILHELGHCDLGYDHRPYKSIMERYHIGERLLDEEEYYLHELFFPSDYIYGKITKCSDVIEH